MFLQVNVSLCGTISEYFMNFWILKITSFVSSHETRRPLFITFILSYFLLSKVFLAVLNKFCMWKPRDRTCPHQLLNAHNSHQVFSDDWWLTKIYLYCNFVSRNGSSPTPGGGRCAGNNHCMVACDKWKSNWMFSLCSRCCLSIQAWK